MKNNRDMRLGIPRAMSYYNNYPFFYGFFNALGIEIVLSGPTTKKTVSNGSSLVVTETCLPIKVYVGHVLDLLDRGVDKIFVPSLQSIAPKIYNCSKIRGLPDLIRNVVKQDFTIIDATLDKSEKHQGLYSFLKDAVAPFGIKDENKIKAASKEGWKVYNNFQIMTRSGIDYSKALKYALQGKVVLENDTGEYPISIAVVAHSYNLFDNQVSMRIFDKLRKMGVKVYSSVNLTHEQMEEGISALNQIVYWANEHEMTGCAGYYLRDNRIDGLITLTAFGCGPDSLMIERIVRKAKEFKKPTLNLTLDEHTGEAGFITRLEAFVDMLYRKKRALICKKLEGQEHKKEEFKPNTNIIEK